MKRYIILLAALMCPPVTGQIRNARPKADEILTIKAALGIATIIQTPGTIQSAIIGDQSGFKIEYLDRSVTVKPLRFGAKTNLYLQTEKRRYNLRLVSVQQDSADYVVYIKESEDRRVSVWKAVGKSVSGKANSIRSERVGIIPQGYVFIELTVMGENQTRLNPENIWVYQDSDSKVINGLFISKTELRSKRPVVLGITLARADLVTGKPVSIRVKFSSETLSIEIPKAALWQ